MTAMIVCHYKHHLPVLNNRSLNSLVGALWLRNACHSNCKTATLAGILGPGMDAGPLTTRTDSYQSICI